MSLTNEKAYHLLEGKKPNSSDNFFLIFGNSELRLKHGEWKVFSNFGIANGFFNNEKETVNEILMAEGKREVDIVGYEVHRVLFE